VIGNVFGRGLFIAIDPNGNTTSKTTAGVTTNFLFDIRDQLGEVRQASNILGRYGYDFQGRRILKIGDDGRRQYTYDQLSVVTEADQVNATVSKYDYGMDQLVRLDNRGEGRSFFHLDFLGSTVGLTDTAGAARQSIFYDAWGNERDRIGTSANKFTFTGHEKDAETGLIYAKARFYDPDIARFLSQDSLLGDVTIAPSLNRYAYAFSNPLALLDLDGRQATRPGRIEGQVGEVANYTESYRVTAEAETCTEAGCSDNTGDEDKKDTGVVEELKYGDPAFTEANVQRIGEIFGGRTPPTPDWQKGWYRNFTESFFDHAAMTTAEPALRIQYGILTDDPQEIAVGVGEQIAGVVLSKGMSVAAEKAALAAIAKYPWLAKPLTEALRDASMGLKGELQKQAQRVVKNLEGVVLRSAPEVGAPGAGGSTGLRVQTGIRAGSGGGGGTSVASQGGVAISAPTSASVNTTTQVTQPPVAGSNLRPARPANLGVAPPHGGTAHAGRIQQVVDRMRQQGWRDIRVNQSQVDANLKVVGTNRPDVSGINPRTGQRVNIEFDTVPANSLRHQAVIVNNDPNAVNVFVVIDPTTGRSVSSVTVK
jgi:RHS repeat-associated protein